MKTTEKITITTILLGVMLIADIPLLPGIPTLPGLPTLTVELVPEAQAVLGVRRRTRRRTAVVAYSAGAASASSASQQQSATAQQQAATAQQQAAVAQQQASASQAASGVPIGTVVETLPAGCKVVTVSNNQYQDCNGSFYKAAFQGNKLIYVVVQNPL